MLEIGRWSFGRVVLVSAAWVAFVVVATGAGVYLSIRDQGASTGSGGIGAVSAGIALEIILAILFGPPLVLILGWLYRRRDK